MMKPIYLSSLLLLLLLMQGMVYAQSNTPESAAAPVIEKDCSVDKNHVERFVSSYFINRNTTSPVNPVSDFADHVYQCFKNTPASDVNREVAINLAEIYDVLGQYDKVNELQQQVYDHSDWAQIPTFNLEGAVKTVNTPVPPATSSLATPLKPSVEFKAESGNYYAQLKTYYQWRQAPKIYITPDPVLTSEDRDALQAAIKEWQTYFPFQTTDLAQEAHIIVKISNKLPITHAYGTTQLFFTPQRDIQRAEILLLNPNLLPHISRDRLKPIFMHELGHAAGLFAHSSHRTDLMAPYGAYNVSQKRRRSILTTLAKNAIGLPFGIVSLPNPSLITMPFSDNDKLTPRDLNTLHLLYNDGKP